MSKFSSLPAKQETAKKARRIAQDSRPQWKLYELIDEALNVYERYKRGELVEADEQEAA